MKSQEELRAEIAALKEKRKAMAKLICEGDEALQALREKVLSITTGIGVGVVCTLRGQPVKVKSIEFWNNGGAWVTYYKQKKDGEFGKAVASDDVDLFVPVID